MLTKTIRAKKLVSEAKITSDPFLLRHDIFANGNSVHEIHVEYDNHVISLFVTSDTQVQQPASADVVLVAQDEKADMDKADDLTVQITKANIDEFTKSYTGRFDGLYHGANKDIHFSGDPNGSMAVCRLDGIDFAITSARTGDWIYLIARMAGDTF